MLNFCIVLFGFTIMVKTERCNEIIMLGDAIKGLSRALDYMKEINMERMVLDGILGIRMVDDQLEMILEKDKIRDEEFRAFLPQISQLQKKAEDTADELIPPFVEKNPGITIIASNWLKNGCWKLDHPDTWTNAALIDNSSHYTDIMKLKSDICANEVTGEWHLSSCSCAISEECWEHMTSLHHSDYWITHQILYLQTAEMCECYSKMSEMIKRFNQKSLQHLYDVFCANVLKEAEIIAENGYPELKQDLFAEQIVVCGMIGFQDFYRPEWLNVMLNWQDPNYYCFGSDNRNYIRDWFSELEEEGRNEVHLEDTCLIHKTAVTIASIAVCIRLMITGSMQ